MRIKSLNILLLGMTVGILIGSFAERRRIKKDYPEFWMIKDLSRLQREIPESPPEPLPPLKPIHHEHYEPEPEPNQSSNSAVSTSVLMKVTAYCPCEKCCGKYADGVTSTGKNAYKTVGVAADPKLLPYGTKLNIPGMGILLVDDTGGAMRQSAKKGIYHIDIRFPNHQQAINWGVKNIPVKLLN